MKEITVRSYHRNEMIDITDMIRQQVQKEGIKQGVAVVYVPHTTAGITINAVSYTHLTLPTN